MIVTVVADVLGKENNGTTVAAMNLIRSLRAKGHVVRILCGDQDKKGQDGYFVVPNYNLGKMLNSYVDKVGVSLAKPDQKVIRDALGGGVDIVHIMVPLSLGIEASKVARELGIPITAGFHMQAENLTSYFKMNKLKIANHLVYKVIYKKLYQYVSAIHYPTEFIRDMFESNIKKKTNGFVISNGVNSFVQKKSIEKPEKLKDKIVLLSIGRLAREKSQDTLINAVKKSKYKDKIQLIFAGQGPKEKEYKKLAKDLPIKPIMKLFPRDEIVDVINYCDLYVHPADVELEGIACLEAIACGKFTIVSDSKQAATRYFAVDKKCIFKKRNPKSLAKVIDYWIEHAEERAEYEKKYLESATVFDQDECMDKMEKMLLSVVDSQKDK